jgi:hypothetical protein
MSGRSSRCLLLIMVVILALPLLSQNDLFGQQPDPAPRFQIFLPQNPPVPPRPVNPYPTPPAPVPVSLGFPQVSGAAGTIFSGTVTRVERQAATSAQPVETVSITFHVENALRGASPGERLTISQWVGLWSSGQRYRVGERVLLFLYPKSKLGLTSCVGGQIGRFPVDRWGRVLLSAQHLSAFRTDPVLGGRSRVPFSDFALAVRRAGEEDKP